MAQNGSANASIEASSTSLPTVVGINYGNSYASIAVVSKARVHFIAIQNQVFAHSTCRKDCQTVSPTRTANVRSPPLSLFMAKKPYACYYPQELPHLTSDAEYIAHRHWRKTSTGEKCREHDNRLQKSPRQKVRITFLWATSPD